MPIYEYRCNNGHTLEVLHGMTDDPLASCTTCRAPVQRVFHPFAVHFKGSGFYTTDYGKDQPKNSDEAKSKASSDDSGKGSADSSSDNSNNSKGASSKSDGSESKSKTGSSESSSSKS